MNGFSVEESRVVENVKMKVIGVGGGGGNMIDHMVREGHKKVELISANTDLQALDNSLAEIKIQLGVKKTAGKGAGTDPEVGKEAAKESYDEIKDRLEYTDIVFIAAGFGGGTGTGASPIIAQAAKENGALTIGVVTTPFNFEGKRRFEVAKKWIEELKKECDSILVIPNEKLNSLIDKKAGIKDAFKIVDDVLVHAVNGMISIVLESGKSDMNVDFEDVKTVMRFRGLALMGIGSSSGEGAAVEAVKNAIQSPLLDNVNINGAKGIIANFKMHPDHPFFDFNEAGILIRDSADEGANVVIGTITDPDIKDFKVEVTIIATGFESNEEIKKTSGTTNINDIKEKTIDTIRERRKVSGGYDEDFDILDLPTYQRNGLD